MQTLPSQSSGIAPDICNLLAFHFPIQPNLPLSAPTLLKMVSSNGEKTLIYNIKLSSVGPGKMTGQDVTYEPSNMDLAMKLHYLKAVYYFPSQAFEGLTIQNFKNPTFIWLNAYYFTCGRFRRSEAGRPYIKCNDCGMRFIEAQCDETLEEWLEMRDASMEKLLVSDQVIGPELQFSPPTFLQLTKFKCGGVSLGLSWAHVLGDAFSVADYMNALGKFMEGEKTCLPLNSAQLDIKPKNSNQKKVAEEPLSVKRIAPVGDHWIAPTRSKMGAFSFLISASELSQLQSKLRGGKNEVDFTPFETISAFIWQSFARIREGDEPKVVTVCKKGSQSNSKRVTNNDQIVSVVQAEFSIVEASPSELAILLQNGSVDEREKIEEAVEMDHGVSDFIVYGANLTFVDLEGADLYGLEIQGCKPVFASYSIDGVGDEGAVLVHPGSKRAELEGNHGRLVTVILPENQAMELKKNGLFS